MLQRMSDYKGKIHGKKLKKQIQINALNLQFADKGTGVTIITQ